MNLWEGTSHQSLRSYPKHTSAGPGNRPPYFLNHMASYNQWVKDLVAVPTDEQAQWIYRTLKNKEHLHIFGRYFFPHIIKGTDDVPDCHLDLIKELSRPEDSAIIFPRGFAKSTWEKVDTIHDIIYGIEPVILYISAILQDAKFHFESIKSELENNELLISIYNYLVPDKKLMGTKWTNTHFETSNGVNIVARGAGKGRGVNIKNQRPTKIICDDIETDDEVKSAVRREKLHRWLCEVVIPSKDKQRGKIKVIGTVLHEMAEILQFYKKHGGIFRKAIESGQSIWPKVYTLKDLDEIKNGKLDENGQLKGGIGSRAFSQEYMNTPTSDEMANFDPTWIDLNYYTSVPQFKRAKIVIYIDPRAGESALADEFAITVLGWDERDVHRYVIEQIAGRVSQLEQAKLVVRAWLRNKDAYAVGAEKVLNQTAVYQYLVEWKIGKIDFNTKDTLPGHGDWIDESDRNIPVVATNPGGKDKVARLQKHEAAFERGEIHLRPEMKILRDQILFLGCDVLDHDDRCDSLVGALDLSYKGMGNLRDNADSVYNERAKQTVAGDLYKEKF